MHLQPENNFTIVRQIANHTDSNQYYVQAVIRNALTDTIIATVNLTDKGGQRFKYDWKVPADPSGQGFYISIVTSVYTDSGYTTKSDNYGDDENTYEIRDTIITGRVGGQGVGVDIFDVKRVIAQALADHKKEMMAEMAKKDSTEPPEVEVDSPEDILERENIAKILDYVSKLKNTEIPKFDPEFKKLSSLIEEVKKIASEKEPDLSKITDLMNEDSKEEEVERAEMRRIIEEGIAKAITAIEDLRKGLNNTEFKTRIVTELTLPEPVKPQIERVKSIDISNLAK